MALPEQTPVKARKVRESANVSTFYGHSPTLYEIVWRCDWSAAILLRCKERQRRSKAELEVATIPVRKMTVLAQRLERRTCELYWPLRGCGSGQ